MLNVNKALPTSIRSISAVALLLFILGLVCPISRSTALHVFGVYRLLAVVVLILLLAELFMAKQMGRRWPTILLDTACSLTLLAIWFVVRAATF